MNQNQLCLSAIENDGSAATPAAALEDTAERGEASRNDILNIRETVARAKAAGYPLSAYTLRRMIKTGAIPCRIVGGTYLISWTNVVRWILCLDGCDNEPSGTAASGGIRVLTADIRRNTVD